MTDLQIDFIRTYGVWTHVTVTVDNTGVVTHYINAVQSGTPGVSAAPSNITND